MSTTPTSTSYAVHGPVAVVTLKRPPVNVLGNALRSSSGQGAAGLFEVCSDNGPIAGHEQPRSNSHECETTF